MKDNTFVNEAFQFAIKKYIEKKQNPNDPEFWTFPIVVIRSLIAIYGELDIINPFRTQNESRMGGLDDNLTKFGYPKEKLDIFKKGFEEFIIARKNGIFPNPYFIKIEKQLIDMFFYRKKTVNIKAEEIKNLQSLIYFSSTKNPVMQGEIQDATNEIEVIDHYWNFKIFESTHNLNLLPHTENMLIPEAYNILGYSLESIAAMDEQTLSELNNKILSFFKINLEEENKAERLQEAISYYKQFGNRITSGNGYVDMLMLLSIIATIMMTLFAITVKVLGG